MIVADFRITQDYGQTWFKERDTVLQYNFSFGNPNAIYTYSSISTKGSFIYKGIFAKDTINIKLENVTEKEVVVSFSWSGTERVDLYLVRENGDTVYAWKDLSQSESQEESRKFSLPENIAYGTYYLRVCPHDTTLYAGTQTEPFEIKQSTAIEEVTETLCFYIKDKSVVSTIDEDVQVFDMLGQRMSVGKSLHDGVYMVQCQGITHKIVIR